MGILLALFQVLLIAIANSLYRSRAFEQLGALFPPFVRDLFGPSFSSFLSFSGIVCVGYFHPAIMGALIALTIAISTAPVSEVETRFMDFILARPVARHWIVSRTLIVTTACTVALLGAMMAGTWLGLNFFGTKEAPWPRPRLVLSLVLNLFLLLICWSGIAMALGASARRRSVAAVIAGLLALASFLLDYVARAWQPAQSLAWLSPFHYYSSFDLLLGKAVSVTNLLILAGVGIAGFVLAYIFFCKRDV